MLPHTQPSPPTSPQNPVTPCEDAAKILTSTQTGSDNNDSSSKMNLIGIYNADGGIIGELSYVGNLITGGKGCGLCKITHNLAFEKKSFNKIARNWFETHNFGGHEAHDYTKYRENVRQSVGGSSSLSDRGNTMNGGPGPGPDNINIGQRESISGNSSEVLNNNRSRSKNSSNLEKESQGSRSEDIQHGLTQNLPAIDLHLLHLNEQSPQIRAFTEGKGSCVILERDPINRPNVFVDILSNDELYEMKGSEDKFFRALGKKFKELGIL